MLPVPFLIVKVLATSNHVKRGQTRLAPLLRLLSFAFKTQGTKMASTVLSEVKLLVSPQMGKVEFEFLTSLFLFDRLETMKFDPLLLVISSELFVDLAAGWFGAAFIVPISSGKVFPVNLGLLTTNIVFGMVCLVIAFKVRKKGVGK